MYDNPAYTMIPGSSISSHIAGPWRGFVPILIFFFCHFEYREEQRGNDENFSVGDEVSPGLILLPIPNANESAASCLALLSASPSSCPESGGSAAAADSASSV
jgi:hypothetical protein